MGERSSCCGFRLEVGKFRWREYHNQDGRTGELSLCPHTKINNYTAIHEQKQPWESSDVHLETPATQWNKKPETNWTKKGRTASFCLCHPILQVGIAQHQEGTPQVEGVPLTGKGKTGVNNQLPQPFGTLQEKTHFRFTSPREQQS